MRLRPKGKVKWCICWKEFSSILKQGRGGGIPIGIRSQTIALTCHPKDPAAQEKVARIALDLLHKHTFPCFFLHQRAFYNFLLGCRVNILVAAPSIGSTICTLSVF